MKALSIIGLVVLLAGCQGSSKEKEQPQENSNIKGLTVEVVNPIEQQPTYSLKLPAELQPAESVEVFAKVKGFVRKINVDVGDQVKKGQILATLEAPEIDIQSTADHAKTQQLKANLEVSRSRYNRLKNVRSQSPGAVSDLEYEQALGSMLRDSAAFVESGYSNKKTNQMREYLVVRAPFNGVITQRNFSVGALMGDTGIPFFKLVDNHKLKLKVVVPELHAKSVSDSTLANFKVMSMPDTSFKAHLKRNAMVIDPVSRSLALEFDVPNQNNMLNGGDYTDVVLSLKRPRPTVFVPQSAVVNSQSGIFVFKVTDDNKVEKIPVSIGQNQDLLFEVFGNINPTDKIIKKASEEINSGQIVQIVK